MSFLKKIKIKKKKKKVAIDLWQWHCRNRREKKLLQLVCGNAIAKIRGEFVTIVTIPLPKMGGGKNSSCQNLGRN